MYAEIRPALVMTALFTVLTGLAFPLGFVGLGKVVFTSQAGGSLVVVNGKTIGSSLLGQNFTKPEYFHPRPSATTDTDAKGNSFASPYNAGNSSGSNLGPTSKALITRVTADVQADGGHNIPGDEVTTSASGLDPDISPENALNQLPRIAAARHISPDALKSLIAAHTQGRTLGLLGEPHINVLSLNMALDAAK